MSDEEQALKLSNVQYQIANTAAELAMMLSGGRPFLASSALIGAAMALLDCALCAEPKGDIEAVLQELMRGMGQHCDLLRRSVYTKRHAEAASAPNSKGGDA